MSLILIEEGMPDMQVRLNHMLQHKRIVCHNFSRLSFILDIENAQSALIVQKRTAALRSRSKAAIASKAGALIIPVLLILQNLLQMQTRCGKRWTKACDDGDNKHEEQSEQDQHRTEDEIESLGKFADLRQDCCSS